MADFKDRTIRLLGEEKNAALSKATVAVFGLGGVGSYALEALARSGVGTLIIADFDRVDITNINRQLLTLHSNTGKLKTEVAEHRIKDINPDCSIYSFPIRITKQSLSLFDSFAIDAAVDCIDTVEDKIELLDYLAFRNIFTVSSMGAAQKLDASKITAAGLELTSVCPLAKKIRKALRERGTAEKIQAVYSTEQSIKRGNGPLGSISYLPAMFGLRCAAETIEYIISD